MLFAPFLVRAGLSACDYAYSGSQTRLVPPTYVNCVELRDCHFASIYYKATTAHGAALSYSSQYGGSVEINSTVFFACHVHTGAAGSGAQGGAVYASCGTVFVFRTCFDNCSSQGTGHALYLLPSSANIPLCTFFKCGLLPPETPTNSVGTLYVKAGSSAATLAVANGNWTDNRALSAAGAVLWADVTVAIPYFRFVTCLQNTGESDFYYTGGANSWPSARAALLFECVNFYRTSGQGSWHFIDFTNAHANFSRCVFVCAATNQLFDFG
jgi:hypothetical protein